MGEWESGGGGEGGQGGRLGGQGGHFFLLPIPHSPLPITHSQCPMIHFVDWCCFRVQNPQKYF
ncbi:hypothetical protein [Tolypothrix sp. VBCCA 56010]|uniref:hypothetical protein n=1 Tax=Tolypothrix sp. VBCCA 56010 TaxID=3137731 RepID=UPI003D7E6E10